MDLEKSGRSDRMADTINYALVHKKVIEVGRGQSYKLLETFANLSLSSLSERIRAQNSTVTGIIDRMEREGLVRRERSTADRRVVHISLSDKGQKLAKQIQVEPMEIFRGALLSLSHGDLRDLLRIMNKLQRYVRTHVADGAMDAAPSEDT